MTKRRLGIEFVGASVAFAMALPLAALKHPTTLSAQAGWDPRVEVTVVKAPTPFPADGKVHLVYELHLTNYSRAPMKLEGLETLGIERTERSPSLPQTLIRTPGSSSYGDARVLGSIEGKAVRSQLYRPGRLRDPAVLETIDGGMSAVVYLWVTVEDGDEVPAMLAHRLSFSSTIEEDGVETTRTGMLETSLVRVNETDPVVIGPPLRGNGWLAANGPDNGAGHRRAIVPVSGRAAIAQRFAIDWVQLYEEGQTWRDDRLDNSNYRCYRTDALAVADATVVSTKDGIPENVPGPDSRAVEITLETVAGNFVILDIGDGVYAFYAHLQPDSLQVETGDHVRRGQVIGRVGNSGNSTEPHLHFHVGDANSPLGAEGLPYIFEAYELQGHGWGFRAQEGNEPELRRMELPMQNQVVRFVEG